MTTARNKISQRQARELQRKVVRLENHLAGQRRSWSGEWPGSVSIGDLNIPAATTAAIRTARLLGHAVVVVPQDGDRVRFYASEVGR